MNRAELVDNVIEDLHKYNYPFLCVGDCYYYKRICVSTKYGFRNVFDTSTDIWRPLTTGELEILLKEGLKRCNDLIVLNNTMQQYHQNRNDFHIATIKGNKKEKQQFFDKAIEAIKKLRELVGY